MTPSDVGALNAQAKAVMDSMKGVGMEAGTYRANPDGSITLTQPNKGYWSGYQVGTTLHSDGSISASPTGPVAVNPDGTPRLSPFTSTGQQTSAWTHDNLVTKLIDSDNPISGTINAATDIANGQYKKAASDFGAGVSGGTLPQIDANGHIVPGDTTKAAGTEAGLPSNIPGVTGPVTGPGGIGDQLKGLLGDLGGGGGSGAPTPATDPGADFRQQQLDYANSLNATINGTAGPSAADIQGHNAQDRAIAQQFAAAQGATGSNSALAYRQALQNAAGISQQGGADAATLRAKEVADAQGQLGGVLSSGRSADLTKYGTDVGAGNTRYAADKDFEGKAIGAAAGAGSGIIQGIISSDKNKKTAIGDGDAEIAAMLDKLQAHKFKYKDETAPGAAPGKRAGVMAQDLEKSMAGKALVVQAPDGGKGIDTPQAVGAMLAALASLHARTKRLEGRG
jgi:hypothetical protein